MENLLKVKDIVNGIANNLDTHDYLSFRQINKEVHDVQLSNDIDSKIWCNKLLLMGLSKTETPNSPPPIEDDGVKEANQTDIIDLFGTYKYFNESNAKEIYSIYYRTFNPLVTKLLNNNYSHFFPQQYEDDPLNQAKILKYIRIYNKSCSVCESSKFRKVETNLNILKEIFINSILHEMEINYTTENFEKAGYFMEILLLCHEETNAVEFFNSKVEFPDINKIPFPSMSELLKENEGTDSYKPELDWSILDSLIFIPYRDFLNDKVILIDTLFKDHYPVVLQFIENFIQQTLLRTIDQLFTEIDEDNYLFLNFFPQIYFKVINRLCDELNDSMNGGPKFHIAVKKFFDVYLEPQILNYLTLFPNYYSEFLNKEFKKYQQEIESNEVEQNKEILNSIRIQNEDLLQNEDSDNTNTNKIDFLTSFTKIFKLSNNSRIHQQNTQEQLNLAYNLNLISKNLQNIKDLISLPLCYKIFEFTREKIEDIYRFMVIETLVKTINLKCQEIFKHLLNQLSINHIKPAFEKAISLLSEYNPNDLKSIEINVKISSKVQPLVQFTELINIGDIILQMISIFYKNELLAKKILDKNKDFLNDVIQCKKSFENIVDDYVADGLNIGINKLMDEIVFLFQTVQLADDFNPVTPVMDIKPTKCAIQVVELLNNHSFLLNGATDKGTIDVYQQEIGERFFNEVVKNIKRNMISTDGAATMICDLNYYYKFMAYKLKQKNIVPLFVALKNIGQLYLISGKDSKELGRMICDVGKFNGIFSQEEVYEFVQRRSDWLRVKRDVEKVMYGLGMKDCIIM
ncbi:Rcy1p NDAI_0F04670 [Naumovozyma dairenensis CBS 421]|uniref:Exocyst complex component Sec10-like alpha-helical bundle domain-containing protein n=1 Tax=Naumovozyma dairenensis (strain ATCC 10597 / BCRC 20456 / CBS 421 / NBRC 0211 / NRRL Y-12639) TaxID=1071378 RepID=G0WDC4_NAUDC|nr:hypothetical protein NDAI_0F04670 [Naumovozyma dairenensis CBS 421]CCD25785.1 hypothetical protein NDAI_0F04670 [Naumovozyma dairenensis CBS 421]